MEHGGEIATLVIPLWTSAAWWSLITTDGTQPEEFVWDWVEIPPLEDMFLPAMSGFSVFSGIPSYRVLALQVSSSSSDHATRLLTNKVPGPSWGPLGTKEEPKSHNMRGA